LRFISARVHGVLDYLVSASLLLGPFLFGFRESAPAAFWASIAGGAANLVYSLLTAYPGGLRELVSFRLHLGFDALIGVALIVVAFAASLSGLPFVYLLVQGGGILGAVLLTDPEP